jgi:hypothetical protein
MINFGIISTVLTSFNVIEGQIQGRHSICHTGMTWYLNTSLSMLYRLLVFDREQFPLSELLVLFLWICSVFVCLIGI